MPVLDWIGKQAVVNHHREVPYRLLHCDEGLSVGDVGTGNLLVEGDNLEALKALLPHYAGRVNLIYIDPPYNTGKEDWTFNDRASSPQIAAWLGKVVGPEATDLTRHDKWLCMMYPRLRLLRDFLGEDGLLVASIDDVEFSALRAIMDELFGRRNHLATFVWQTEGNFDNQGRVKVCHEYLLAYCRNEGAFPAPQVVDPNVGEGSKLFRPEIVNTIVKNGPKNPESGITLPVGFPAAFESGRIAARADAFPRYAEDVVVENGALARQALAVSGWSSKRICERFIAGGFEPVHDSRGTLTTFRVSQTGAIEAVKVRDLEEQGHVISVLRNVGTTNQQRLLLKRMGLAFSYPKPVDLVKYLISLVRSRDALVMDSFAGSGTTGHAVLAQNEDSEHGGYRRFILVELESQIAVRVTRERLRRAIRGYAYTTPNGQTVQVEGLGGGFRYCRLGEPLFDAQGRISPAVTFEDLARHVFFSEAGEPLAEAVTGHTPLLGVCRGRAVYLLFNGVLRDKRPNGGNVLTSAVLASLPPHGGPRVVYGVGCRLGLERLHREGIVFKQIPYELRVD